jgi:geranylgeranyl pyrophosphate synthase
MEYALGRLDFYVKEAVDALSVLPESFERDLLEKLAHFTARRDK